MKPTRSTIAAVWIVCVISFFAVITLDAQRQEIRRSGVISSISDWLRDSGFLEAEDAAAAKTALEIGAGGVAGTVINTAETVAGQIVKFTDNLKTNAAPATAGDLTNAIGIHLRGELDAKAALSGATLTGPLTTTRLITPSVRITRRSDYTHVAAETPVELDLATNTIQKLVAVDDLTLTLANHTAGATYDVRITNSTASAITVTLASVLWEGFWPGSIAGNKVGRIWLECDADAPTTVFGSYAETP